MIGVTNNSPQQINAALIALKGEVKNEVKNENIDVNEIIDVIDDNVISQDKTWSSDKINTELNANNSFLTTSASGCDASTTNIALSTLSRTPKIGDIIIAANGDRLFLYKVTAVGSTDATVAYQISNSSTSITYPSKTYSGTLNMHCVGSITSDRTVIDFFMPLPTWLGSTINVMAFSLTIRTVNGTTGGYIFNLQQGDTTLNKPLRQEDTIFYTFTQTRRGGLGIQFRIQTKNSNKFTMTNGTTATINNSPVDVCVNSITYIIS